MSNLGKKVIAVGDAVSKYGIFQLQASTMERYRYAKEVAEKTAVISKAVLELCEEVIDEINRTGSSRQVKVKLALMLGSVVEDEKG